MPELLEAFRRVAEASAFSSGPYVRRFEEEFATFCGSTYAVGMGSGTDSLWMTLMALGIGPGDEVITVPNGFVATVEAITLCGARPVFVDVDEKTFTLNVQQLDRAITLRTQAIIPVHLFGQMADMDPILAIARRYGTPVIEEASQAHGATQNHRRAGSMGVAGCFSFYPGKNLGAFGEAGATVTDEPDLKARLDMLRDHGQTAKHLHSTVGYNARMDEIQAAVLSVKLKYLQEGNEARRRMAQFYDEQLADEPRVLCPQVAPGNLHAYHIYAVRVKDRDGVMNRMARHGVQCGVHYPVPIHLQRAYQFLGLRAGSFPVAERCAREFLSLPIHPGLEPEQARYVVDCLKESLAESAIPSRVAALQH